MAIRQYLGAMVTVGGVTHLAAGLFYPCADPRAAVDQMLQGVRGDLVEIHQDQLAEVAVEQRARGQEAIAASLVDAVRNRKEHLYLGNTAGHGMGEKDIAAV